MKCPRCNSENVHVQARAGRKPIVIACVLALSGLGLMFLGIIGLALGVVVGLIIGVIIKALVPAPTETIAVCQSCGYTSKPIDQSIAKEGGHSLFCTDAESNFVISRTNVSCGSAVGLRITVDDCEQFTLSNDMTVNLRLNNGCHRVHYEQSAGLGKKNRTGFFDVCISCGNTYYTNFEFTSNGISVSKSW